MVTARFSSELRFLQERSRKGIMDGFALDVGHLRKGPRPFKVQRPNFSEDYLREGLGDLTLRAEEVDTLKACVNVDHIEENKWRPPLVDADWHAFCQAICKGIEGKEWEDLYFHYREMSKGAGTRKPRESQRAKALWAMKAAKDRREEFYDPARKDNILGRTPP